MRSRARFGAGAVLLAAAMAACSAGNAHPAAIDGVVPDAGAVIPTGPTTDASTPPPPAADAQSPPDEGYDASDASNAVDAADAADAPDPFACPPRPAIAPASATCDPAGTWGVGIAVSLPTGAGDALVSMTPDERTVVWSKVVGPQTTLHVSDRSSPNDTFALDAELSALAGAASLALSPDGLRLLLVSADGTHLAQVSRRARDDPFGTDLDDTPFVAMNGSAPPDNVGLSDLAVSPDDLTLVYSTFDPTSDKGSTIMVSTRATTQDAWPLGTPLSQCELQPYGPARSRHPTALSADGLTLFYTDDARGGAHAAWRASQADPFSTFEALGAGITSPQPNAACRKLYYSAPSGPTPAVFSAGQ